MCENNAYCFLLLIEWLTCLLLFIMAGFEKLQPQFKNSTHFSCYESLSKGCNVLMSLHLTLTRECHTMVNDNVVASTVCTDTLSQERKSAYQINLEVM